MQICSHQGQFGQSGSIRPHGTFFKTAHLKNRASHALKPQATNVDNTPQASIETESSFSQPHQQIISPRHVGIVGTALVASVVAANPALAFEIHTEPTNALSLPTWMVHTSSVIEWCMGMILVWQYAEVTGKQRVKALSWGMLPCLGSAMCACTWHFFYNSEDLQFLVSLQAALTVFGNFTCWYAAWLIFKDAKEQEAAQQQE